MSNVATADLNTAAGNLVLRANTIDLDTRRP